MGALPAYQPVLEQVRTPVIALTAPREPLVRAIRRVSIAAEHGQNVVRFAVEDGALALTANTPSVGSAFERLAVQATGAPLIVAFNGRFLLDALDSMDTERVRLGLTGATTPAVVTPADAGEPLTVIAPVRTYD